MEEKLLQDEELPQSEEILRELQQLSLQMKEISKRVSKIDKKTDQLSKRAEPFKVKLKNRLIAMAKKPTIFGRILKKLIYFYRISWRWLYCLKERRKGVQNNKICFISHRGMQYSCNPMYLSKYLTEHYPGQFEIVWAFNDPKKFSFLKSEGIRVVCKESKEHLRHLMTAKVIITNVDFYVYLPKVRGQIALDTWHGGGCYKTCGFANAQNLMTNRQKRHFKRLYSKVNLYCSSSQAFTQQTIRESRLFQGEVLEVGMPRNDILVNGGRPDIKKKVQTYFDLGENTKIVLYAPTYRSQQEMAEMPTLNVEGLLSALQTRFGGEWTCLFRQHHLSKAAQKGVLSATEYPDMQELLYAADVLVSDYSSCIWDFSLMLKPIFLFCPDLERYSVARDFYVPIDNWHFILTQSQDELEGKILNFDEAEYRQGIERHHQELGDCETGQATRFMCERIYKECFPTHEAEE